jgi:hypothetical protein
MKTQTGIWIDSERAIIVSFQKDQHEIKEIKSDVESKTHYDHEGDKGSFMGKGTHHINKEKTFDERRDHEYKHFIDAVLDEVKNADELFVFGPSETKIKFEKQLEQEKIFAGKLKGVEPADHMTTPQIVAKVKDFYKL